MLVYKITNKINRKVYIGCTTKNIELRWNRHWVRRKDKTLLARAIEKYGEASKKLKLNFTGIQQNVLGNQSHVGGYIFQKLTDEHLIF